MNTQCFVSRARLTSKLLVCSLSLATVISQTALVPSETMACQISEDAKSKMDNPFLSPSKLPLETFDFSKIKDDQFMPAFQAGMAEQKKQMQAIADSSEEPTFANTLEAMERTGEILTRVQSAFGNLASAHTNPEIQKIQVAVSPLLAAHSDDIYLMFCFIENTNRMKRYWCHQRFNLYQRRLSLVLNNFLKITCLIR